MGNFPLSIIIIIVKYNLKCHRERETVHCKIFWCYKSLKNLTNFALLKVSRLY